MRSVLVVLALGLAACTPAAEVTKTAQAPAAPAAKAPEPITAPAGDYKIDPDHTSVTFRVSHLGFSNYTARFTGFAATLKFDPANPSAQTLEATIDADSVETDYRGPPKIDFDSQLEREFLHADQHPKITFKSTGIQVTGPRAANVTGELTLNGVTKPVVLATTFNGGYPPNAMDPGGARIGFSATGKFKRSDFGITYGLPAPGTNMGVFDDVEVIIETEFSSKPAA